MGVNDEGGNKTLARTIDLDALKDRDVSPYVGANLVLNPIFENIGTEHANGLTLHTNFSTTFQYAPGWYNFGADSSGSIGASVVQTLNPFRMKGNKAGLLITQNDGVQYGLCQPILRAAQISGRRVRVTGAYEVKTGPGGGVQAGMSVFLVTKVSSAAVDPATTPTFLVSEKYWRAAGTSGNWDAIRLENTTALKHVVRVACSGSDYETGEELFNRAFDWWDIGGTVPDKYTEVFLGSDNENAVDAEGLGATGIKQAVDIYFLGSVATPADGTGTSGMLELVKDTSTAGSGLQTFETFVDIPEDMFADDAASGLYQDAWLVFMPVHPDDISSMTQSAEVRVYALSLEPVVEDLAGRLIFGMQSSSPAAAFGAGIGGFPIRHLLRYPVYVPALYILDVHGLVRTDEGATNASGYITRPEGESLDQFDLASGCWKVSEGNGVFVARQSDLPPGSAVLKASFTIWDMENMRVEASLYQVLNYDPRQYVPGGVSYPLATNMEEVLEWNGGNPYNPPISDQVNTADARRNRIGFHWPVASTSGGDLDGGSGSPGNLEDASTLGGASLWLRAETTDGENNVSLEYVHLKSGWVLAAVDPRWPHAQWKRTP